MSMATATLKRIDDETLAVLRSIEWNDNAAVLTCGQLDRKLYQSVNKVLESLGGKWSRKAKSHLFDSDAQDDLEAVIENGGYVDRKQALGHFETPDVLANEVVQLAGIRHGELVLEPSAGTGQLIRAVRRACDVGIAAVEIDGKHNSALVATGAIVVIDDFLSQSKLLEIPNGFHRVVMNPPFAPRQCDIDHVMHAWTFLRPGGRLVAITSIGWTFRTNRKSLAFREFVEECGWWRSNAADAFKSSGTMVKTCVVVLSKEES